MKHLFYTTAFLFFTLYSIYTTAQNYRWAHGFGGPNFDAQGTSIATDTQANVYVTGFYGDSIDFDPGLGATILAPSYFPNGQSFFIAKYDSASNIIWAINLDGFTNWGTPSLAVNATGLYVTGCFLGTTDFDPSGAVANLTATDADIFLAKYDLNGNYQWAINMGGIDVDVATSIAIDNIGNSYITGFFDYTADFDPSVGVANLIANADEDAFVAKYDVNGNYQWAFNLGCNKNNTGILEEGYAITTDPFGVLVTGKFGDTTDFDPGSGVYNLDATTGKVVFVAKYDFNGNFIWAGNIGGQGGKVVFSITPDLSGSGDFYIAGGASDSVDFALTTGDSIINCYTGSSFFCKYDNNSNLIFVRFIGGGGRSIITDLTGNIYLTGAFAGTKDFDPGTGIVNLTAAGPADIFFAKYDNSGNYIWAKGVGGFSTDWGQGIALDNLGNQYLTGFFSNTVDFDPDSGTVLLSGAGGNKTIFIAKYADLANIISQFYQLNNKNLSVFPNPATNMIYIQGIEPSLNGNKLIISDMAGRNVFETNATGNSKVNVSSFKPGIYLIVLYSVNHIQRTIFIRQ